MYIETFVHVRDKSSSRFVNFVIVLERFINSAAS